MPGASLVQQLNMLSLLLFVAILAPNCDGCEIRTLKSQNWTCSYLIYIFTTQFLPFILV